MSVLIFSTAFLFLTRNERDITKMFIGLKVQYALILSDFKETLRFLYIFWKNKLVSNFMKIRPVAALLFHADRQTDRHDKTNSRF